MTVTFCHPNGVTLPGPGFRLARHAPRERTAAPRTPDSRPPAARLLAVLTDEWKRAADVISAANPGRSDLNKFLRQMVLDGTIQCRASAHGGLEYRLAPGEKDAPVELCGADLAVYRFLQTNPGSSIQVVADNVGRSVKTTRERLARMTKKGYLTRTNQNESLRYFVKEADDT